MNNIKNNVIIVIFVLIFIGYFYFEKNIFQYNNVKRNVENFQQQNLSSNSSLENIIKNSFTNYKSVNNNLEKISLQRIKIFNLIIDNNFTFNKIVSKSDIQKYFTNISVFIKNNNKILNNTINILGNMPNVNYLSKIKNLFVAYRNLNNKYLKYYNNYFLFSKFDNKINDDIIKSKIIIEKSMIEDHGNIGYLINSISSNLHKERLSKAIHDFIKKFLEYENEKNDLMNNIINQSSLFTNLSYLNEINKKKKKILNEDKEKLQNSIFKKKKQLNSIMNIVINQNKFIEDNLNFEINRVNARNQEIEFLYSVNNNNNMLTRFCQKMRKLDKPTESDLITKRLHKEFKKKKEKQIHKLEEEINNIINTMTEEQINRFNSYIMRTHDQASKQLEAIKKAQLNLENAKKFKINVS